MKKKYSLFFILYISLIISLLFSTTSSIGNFVFFVFFESILVLFIIISLNNKIALLYSISIFIYFHQVPMLDLFPQEKMGSYSYQLDDTIKFELFFVYTIIIFCFFWVLDFILRKIRIDGILVPIKNSKIIDYISLTSAALSFFWLFMAFISVGGFENYIMLDKFEISKEQKFYFFSFKDFAIIMFMTGFLSEKKYIFYITLVSALIFVGVEIISTKRFLLFSFLISLFICRVKEVKHYHILYGVASLMLMGLVKITYYNIKNYSLGAGSFADIFWFDWSDALMDLIFIHEGRAHIELFINYIYRDITFYPSYVFNLLAISLPFGHQIVTDFMTAGEYMKRAVYEPWSGLASAQYITPYLSLGLLGIFFTYIYNVIMFSVYTLSYMTNSLFIRILLLINVPVFFFYSQREELVIFTKSLYVSLAALFIVFLVSQLIYFLLKKNENYYR